MSDVKLFHPPKLAYASSKREIGKSERGVSKKRASNNGRWARYASKGLDIKDESGANTGVKFCEACTGGVRANFPHALAKGSIAKSKKPSHRASSLSTGRYAHNLAKSSARKALKMSIVCMTSHG